jgi:hypothetical protein
MHNFYFYFSDRVNASATQIHYYPRALAARGAEYFEIKAAEEGGGGGRGGERKSVRIMCEEREEEEEEEEEESRD